VKKIKNFLSEHPEYIAIAVIVLVIVFFIVQFSQPEFVSSAKIYLGKSITEMTIGEFLFCLWLVNAIFSK
jgi:hypothetical protein